MIVVISEIFQFLKCSYEDVENLHAFLRKKKIEMFNQKFLKCCTLISSRSYSRDYQILSPQKLVYRIQRKFIKILFHRFPKFLQRIFLGKLIDKSLDEFLKQFLEHFLKKFLKKLLDEFYRYPSDGIL